MVISSKSTSGQEKLTLSRGTGSARYMSPLDSHSRMGAPLAVYFLAVRSVQLRRAEVLSDCDGHNHAASNDQGACVK
jgi:hypothetical protein